MPKDKYYIQGLKYPETTYSNMTPLELDEDDRKILSLISMSKLFDHYTEIAKSEDPSLFSAGLIKHDDIDNMSLMEFVDQQIGSGNLVLYEGRFGEEGKTPPMWGFVGWGEGDAPDTIFTQSGISPERTGDVIAHELGHLQETEGGDVLKHYIEDQENWNILKGLYKEE